MTKLIHSISGTRGIIGDNLTPQVAMEIAQAYGTFIGKGPVIVGGDTRTSHDMIKSAVISGLLAVGTDVIDIGRVPTPTVQQMIRHFNAQGGIVITASHNPIIWNGLKLMNNTGSFFEAPEFEKFDTVLKNKDFLFKEWDGVGQLTIIDNAIELHVDKILTEIDITDIKAANLSILVDPNNGAGAAANATLLDRLGIDYDMINAEPNGKFFHDPEPLKKNLAETIDVIKNGNYDIGFVQDADADRLVILDETGHFIGEDYSLAFCMDYILSTITDTEKRAVVNLSTSNVITWLCEQHNAKLTHTKIGEANVTAEIKAQAAHVGGEGNGGIIYPKIGWGRDSLVGIVIALKHLAQKKKKVSEIVANYPKFVMLREKQNLANRDDLLPFLEKVKTTFPDAEINTIDGVKASYKDAWIHVRPSNTEPIARIFIEAPSEEKAQEYFAKLTC